jgi:hypothetical protein
LDNSPNRGILARRTRLLRHSKPNAFSSRVVERILNENSERKIQYGEDHREQRQKNQSRFNNSRAFCGSVTE